MREKTLENTYARFIYLKSMLKQPFKIPESTRQALAGQRSFSELAIDGEFDALALNSLKSAADKILENESETMGGWALLNSMRVSLYEKTKQLSVDKRRINKSKRADFDIDKIKNIAKEAELLANQCSIAYLDLFSKVTNIISNEPGMDERIRLKLNNLLLDHKLMYRNLISPISSDAPELKVIRGGFKK